MRVVIGPVSTDSAELWLTYARGVLDELHDIAPGECFATPEVREIFEQYVSSWEAEAETDGAFLWSCDVPAEEAEFHVHAFHQLATMLNQRAEEHGTPLSPEGGQEFYAALLRGVLSALEAESQASAEFAQHLGQFWPGQALVIR